MSRRPVLNAFSRSYAETALWSSTDYSEEGRDEPLDENYDVSDIAPATLRQMVKDCNAFRRSNRRDLRESGLSNEQAGHDFWLTRNRHGAGFWDEGSGSVFKRLTDAAHAYGSYDLYVGSDGKVHGQ